MTVALPTGAQPGELLLAQIAIRGGSALTIAAPGGWALVRRDNSGTAIAQAIYTHIVQASPAEPTQYSWTFNAGNNATAAIADYLGATAASPVDVSNGLGQSAATAIAAPPVVIPAASGKDRLIACFATAGGVAPVTPAGTTQEWSFRAVSYGIGMAMADVAVQPAGATPVETAMTSTAYGAAAAQVALH